MIMKMDFIVTLFWSFFFYLHNHSNQIRNVIYFYILSFFPTCYHLHFELDEKYQGQKHIGQNDVDKLRQSNVGQKFIGRKDMEPEV